ncbi:uncharacterized protein LOC144658423 [Oculina patagonica]
MKIVRDLIYSKSLLRFPVGFLLFLVLVIIANGNFQSVRDLCRHLKFTPPIQGFALQGHMLRNLSIGIYASCKDLCTMESRCVSFNLGPPINDRMVCELSDSDNTQHPDDLIPREGFVYRSTENPCSSSPCSHNGTCLNGFSDKRYLCDCKPGYTGEQCERENWRKITTDPVCFGTRGDKYGTFTIQEDGQIYTFKLIHRNGSLICATEVPPSNWGCPSLNYGNDTLMTLITYVNKTVLPLAEYVHTSGSKYRYHLATADVNSETLVFNKLPIPMSVSTGQQFQIWYAQDLTNELEDNNGGQTCTDVYAFYDEN